MACFLIDYENESGRSLEGVSLLGLTRKDEIIFFYSRHTARITMELHKELEKIPAKKQYIEIETGTPNALDFQLSTYLGARIQKNVVKQYVIVSRDCGYDCVCRFWKNRDVDVKRIDRFSYYADIKEQ